MSPVESKTARITILLDPAKKRALEVLCAKQDLTPSQVIRRLVRDYLAFHKQPWTPTGGQDDDERDS